MTYPQYLPANAALVRYPLSRAHRKSAMWVGALSHGLFSLGVSGFSALVGGGFVIFAESLGSSGATSEFSSFLNLGGVALMAGCFVLGVGGTVGGLLVSFRFLRARGIQRPQAVTWSAFGIERVAALLFYGSMEWVMGYLVAFEALRAMNPTDDQFTSSYAELVVYGVPWVMAIVAAILAAVVGMLSTWWMAHVFRPSVTPQAVQYAPPPQHPWGHGGHGGHGGHAGAVGA